MANSILKKVFEKFDGDEVFEFGKKDIFANTTTWSHTGSPELEYNLGILGFPVGITEISGLSKSGKTTIALHGMKNFQMQNPNGICIILSSENRDNKEYAERIGVDTSNVMIIRSKFVEDLFLKTQIAIDEISLEWKNQNLSGKPKIYCYWDSIGATLSRAEVDAFRKNVEIVKKNINKEKDDDLKNAQMGSFAKNAKAYVKAILGQVYEKDIIFVMLNHRYDKMEGWGGTRSGGGRWIEFLPCLRLELSRKEWIKIDGVEVGQITRVKVEKNDFGSRKETEIELLLGCGIVLSESDIEFAIEKGILKKEGVRKISFLNKLKWSSKREFYQNYIDENKLLPLLHKKVMRARHDEILKSKNKI